MLHHDSQQRLSAAGANQHATHALELRGQVIANFHKRRVIRPWESLGNAHIDQMLRILAEDRYADLKVSDPKEAAILQGRLSKRIDEVFTLLTSLESTNI